MNQRVLIIDDDEDVRRILGLRLRHVGLTVGEAADGAEGLSALRNSNWDLVLLDLMMPNVDGFDFLSELRGRTGPPVVVITQLDDPECQEQARALGASQYVTKRTAFDRRFVNSVQRWVGVHSS